MSRAKDLSKAQEGGYPLLTQAPDLTQSLPQIHGADGSHGRRVIRREKRHHAILDKASVLIRHRFSHLLVLPDLNVCNGSIHIPIQTRYDAGKMLIVNPLARFARPWFPSSLPCSDANEILVEIDGREGREGLPQLHGGDAPVPVRISPREFG